MAKNNIALNILRGKAFSSFVESLKELSDKELGTKCSLENPDFTFPATRDEMKEFLADVEYNYIQQADEMSLKTIYKIN